MGQLSKLMFFVGARPRRRNRAALLSVALIALTWMGVGAAQAHAGDLRVRASIQGSGYIDYGFGGQVCNEFGNVDDRQARYCGQRVKYASATDWGPATTLTAHTYPADSEWEFVRWEGECASVSGNQCFVDAPDFSAGEPDVTAVYNDRRAPEFTLHDTQYLNDLSASVGFSVAGNWSSLECRRDDQSWGECPSHDVIRYGGLTEGPHQFQVRGTDPSGQVGYSVERTVTIVDTRLDTAPALVGSRTIVFSFTSGAGTAFSCQVDGGAWTPCASPRTVTVPSDGGHTFRVRAASGNAFDPVAAEHTWTVDTLAPQTTLVALEGPQPDTEVYSNEARFAFSSSETPASFTCRLDGGAWASCISTRTFAGLSGGRHTFEVRASDAVGNTDPTPAARSWIAVVDEDSDGVLSNRDCDDRNASVSPSRPEILDNDVDENCDGVKGENLDRDADGVNRPTDCNDGDAGINPNRPEILDNGVDENCDGADAINFDRDGDGATRPADCDDGNPNVRPGSADVPNNGIDEDCRDGDFREPIQFDLARSFARFPAVTVLTRLQVKKIPTGSMVKAICKFKSKKCPKKARKAFTKRNAAGNVTLKQFTKLRFKPGTTITVTVTKPGAIGAVKVLTIRRGKEPAVKDLCLPPGAAKPVSC